MSIFNRKKKLTGPIGYLVFDTSIPNCAPYLALDNADDMDVIRDAKYVTLKVIRTKTGSQK